MGTAHYLAMTAAELYESELLPPNIAWMSCHFSAYSTGLSNLPEMLPPDSLLILDDSAPMDGHDPQLILEQLESRLQALSCRGLLLDFQRPEQPEAASLAGFLAENLSFPVCVSSVYAKDLTCPVSLPPVPCHVPLKEHLALWQDREIWLETALDGEVLTLTKKGCLLSSAQIPTETGFSDECLHCHYRIDTTSDTARFTLWRTQVDLDALLEEAGQQGVTLAVGLWQEFHSG